MSEAPTEPVIVDAQHDGSTARIEMLVPGDLLYFRGHFPNFPVLPGIVQTHWAIAYARRYLSLGAADVAAVQVKFKRVIVPDQRIRLELSYARDRHRLSFEYRDQQAICSSGVISLTGA